MSRDLRFTLRNVADSLALVSEPSEITRSAARILRSLADTPSVEPGGMAEVREWLRSRAAAKWSSSFDAAFRRGYDTAVEEVTALLPTQASDSSAVAYICMRANSRYDDDD